MEIEQVKLALSKVTDPEIPVLSLNDLGVLRDIQIEKERIVVTITPTYSGCPALEQMTQDIISTLELMTNKSIKVKTQISPAWTTDWITETGKKALFDYGIMPPSRNGQVICPQCKNLNVSLISKFSSTACKALYKCEECLEPFDYFKCH